MNKDQKLDLHEFTIAMFLIGARKKGLELPPALPDALIASAKPETTTSTTPKVCWFVC
jgi:hypothetical protein